MTVITKTVEKSVSVMEWLQDLLLPLDNRTTEPTIESVTDAMRGWNAAEIGDAISAIIMAVALRDGKPGTELAQRYAADSLIQRGVGLRRGSRVDAIRTREKLPMAWAALRATLEITFEAVPDRLTVEVETPVVDEFRFEISNGMAMSTPLADCNPNERSIRECIEWEREQEMAALHLAERRDSISFDSVTKPDRRLARIEQEARDAAFDYDGRPNKRRAKRQRKHVAHSRSLKLHHRLSNLNAS